MSTVKSESSPDLAEPVDIFFPNVKFEHEGGSVPGSRRSSTQTLSSPDLQGAVQHYPPALVLPMSANLAFRVTPEATRLWAEASHVAEQRMHLAEQYGPNVPLPPSEAPPAMDLEEECLLTLMLIAERKHLERRWAKMKKMQAYLGIQSLY